MKYPIFLISIILGIKSCLGLNCFSCINCSGDTTNKIVQSCNVDESCGIANYSTGGLSHIASGCVSSNLCLIQFIGDEFIKGYIQTTLGVRLNDLKINSKKCCSNDLCNGLNKADK
ncbi:unnamed protein product, partial [Brachionus calyciflorus]